MTNFKHAKLAHLHLVSCDTGDGPKVMAGTERHGVVLNFVPLAATKAQLDKVVETLQSMREELPDE